MRIEYPLPTRYRSNIPLFEKDGKLTERAMSGLENVLCAYTDAVEESAKAFENNPANYEISDVFVVGSGARENKADSDLDFLFIAQNLDETSAKNMKLLLSYIFFCDRPKAEAIDVFIRKQDIYPDRPSIKITDKVKPLLLKYMEKLKWKK